MSRAGTAGPADREPARDDAAAWWSPDANGSGSGRGEVDAYSRRPHGLRHLTPFSRSSPNRSQLAYWDAENEYFVRLNSYARTGILTHAPCLADGCRAIFPIVPEGNQIDAPMPCQGLLSLKFGEFCFPLRGGQDREGPLLSEGTLLSGHGVQLSAGEGPGRPADRSKASTGCGSRIAGQAAPGAGGVSGRRAGGGRPRGRRTASGSG
jgi:hypothetical protein